MINFDNLTPVEDDSNSESAKFLNQFNTRHEIALMAPKGSIGVELGVDTGQLSERFLNLHHFSSFHSVDRWDPANDEWDVDEIHSRQQYLDCAKQLMKYPEARIWRMTAQEFAELVPDEMFGFIYIDCYAHTGQDDGEVLRAFWPKLAPGGVFAGDDYSPKWPKTVEAVDAFAEEIGKEVQTRSDFCRHTRHWQDACPTWYWFK